MLVVACSGSDAAGIPSVKTTDPYTTLRLNVRAAVMSTVAPYDTLQLSTTAYDANGVLIPLPGPVKYIASDTTLSVSATGLVTVRHKTGTNSYVIARVQDTTLLLTHADTAFILATTTVPAAPLAQFSIQPVAGDSAILDVNGSAKTPTVTALDAQGHAIPTASLLKHFVSSNATAATINAKTGAITAVTPGTTVITATATYYGVTKTDSLVFQIGYPDVNVLYTNAITQSNGTYAYYWITRNLVVGIGKTVIFSVPDVYALINQNTTVSYTGTFAPAGDRLLNESLNVIFDDSTAPQTSRLSDSLLTVYDASSGVGNINLQIPDSMNVVDSSYVQVGGPTVQYSKKLTAYCKSTGFPCAAARSFSTPGSYTYHSPATGASGTIIVVAH